MFDKILIANRGEIAVRVMRTAQRLGVRTVAVYSEADANAMHVDMADEAVCIGAAPASQSYLRSEAILEIARRTGTQAIHPGYGFLSENAAFAAACAAAGIVFIGPPVEAIRIMGSKIESKHLMAAAGVPLVPGYHGRAQDSKTLAEQAERIGYPLLVKASAGGGGKGMRVVHRPEDLADAIAGAKRESTAAFGDDTLLLEKYLVRPRHVEIQVFADMRGNCIYVSDRDCSIQRRHQKVIEEAPAPSLPEALRAGMGEAAVAAARAVRYVGAGTVEFLYESGAFYFIEMNTRLQVEHPVTEMITGLDLVEWQLRIASGEPLPRGQEQLAHRGHSFEARLYAEDPQREFLPSTGRLAHVRPPFEGPHVRVDTGIRSGDEVSVHYDPMIAKLIVWDEDRPAALRRLRRALAEYEVVGVTTNIPFLAAVAAHPAFAAAEIDTAFIERHRGDLAMAPVPVSEEELALGALAIVLRRDAEAHGRSNADPHSPWNAVNGWRLNADNQHEIKIKDGDALHEIVVHFRRAGYEIEVPSGRRLEATNATLTDGALGVVLDGVRTRARAVFEERKLTLLSVGRVWRAELYDPTARSAEQAGGSGHLVAPMPGTVAAVLVTENQSVELGQPLLVLEAMKMEHTIRAPLTGRVERLLCRAGQQVSDGTELLRIVP